MAQLGKTRRDSKPVCSLSGKKNKKFANETVAPEKYITSPP
jgi:hypothetical protein